MNFVKFLRTPFFKERLWWLLLYRKGNSCITVLLKLRDDIQCALNSSEVTIALFADYSKTFATTCFESFLKS